MTRALTEKIRADQHRSHTDGSTCTRCGGLMVTDFSMDLLFCIGETEFSAKRCVQCGEIVDPVILSNRGTKQEPTTVQLPRKIGPTNFVTKDQ